MSASPGAPEYAWTVEPARWAPRGRPKPPFGPTTVEVIRSCPLRVCFERSAGYEPRLSFDARIGIAFHRALEALNASDEWSTGAEAAGWAQARFFEEIRAQESEADQRPRERLLPRNPARVAAAAEALLVAAHRLAVGAAGASAAPSGGLPLAEAEITVQSTDGLFRGRVDRADHGPGGTRITDYKSALRDDLPERYERQLQLYAAMWRDTRGDWPVAGSVVYPLTGRVHDVLLAPEKCESVARESAELVLAVGQCGGAAEMARPGEVCQVCAYRPWCQPFWDAQAAAHSGPPALDRARYGLEGRLEALTLDASATRASIHWRGCRVDVVAAPGRFPQLCRAAPGDDVRLLDAELTGLRHQPRARISERSELFLLAPPHASE